MARPVQMVQRLSNKMAAMRRQGPQVDQNPLVRYHGHGPQPPSALSERPPVETRPTPWRRSRVQRINHLKKRRRERFMRTGPGSRRIRTVILSTIAALALVLISTTAGYAYNFYSSELPQVQNLANAHISQSTHIYDRNGTLLYTLYANSAWGSGGRSTPVSYINIPGIMQDAQIATEDPTFWTNNGLDPQGILRAATALASHGGQINGGGSTMTQQLIKNLSHNAKDTFQRKAAEAALAVGLTNQYPKWKIMEMYFNDTPYGAQELGVDAAVEDYFGLKAQCTANFKCTPAIAFLDRDLTKCKDPNKQSTCPDDPTGMLGLARAVLLAGIPQNPTKFDPTTSDWNFNNVLTNRVPYVIDQMISDNMHIRLGLGANADDPKLDKGPITEAMKPQIVSMISNMQKNHQIVGFKHTELAPHFVNWVIQTLSESLGNGDSDAGYKILETAGLNIYTTLDLPLEQYVEADVKHNLRDKVRQEYVGGYGPLNTVYNLNDAAAVAMNAKTGEVLAMDGSVDYNDSSAKVQGNVNVATSNMRQPGSSFKPIVYAAAFEKGWNPGTRILDAKTYFPTSDPGNSPVTASNAPIYTPTDYGKTYHNVDETARVNLANSFNIPAIKAFMYAGFNNVVDMARRLGVTDIDLDAAQYNKVNGTNNQLDQIFGPSLALGSAGVSLLQMTDAYQTFADNGMHIPPHNILDIWDNYGHNLYHYDPTHPNGVQVLSPQISFMISSMLSDTPARNTYEFGGTDTLTMGKWDSSRPVAAKTGTTNGPLDNWTMGYTPNVVVGVWSGNADGNDPMSQRLIGITGAGPIWHDVITYMSGAPAYGTGGFYTNDDQLAPAYSGPRYTDQVFPTPAFTAPSGMVQTSLNPLNGLEGTGLTDWVLQNEIPSSSGMPTCTTSPDPNNPGGNNPGGNNNGNGNPTGAGSGSSGSVGLNCPETGTNSPGGNNSDWPFDPFGN
jgi:membrane peptidoglycan carboxypeptidase